MNTDSWIATLEASVQRTREAIDNVALEMHRFGAVARGDPYPVGDWAMKRKIDEWEERQKRAKMMAKYNYYTQPTTMHMSGWTGMNDQWYSTSDTSSSAYTMVTYAVPPGTTQVTFPQFNWADARAQEFVREERRRLAPPLAFNRYINASDLLEEFIRWAGSEGVRQGEVLQLPLDAFVKWLIIRACEEDQEEPTVDAPHLPRRRQPRCVSCQRWMPRQTAVPLHRVCAPRHFDRMELVSV